MYTPTSFLNRSSPQSGARLRSTGFTLVELLVVIAIIGILVGIVLGISGYAGRKSGSAKAQAEIERIKTALEEYRLINGRYYAGYMPVTNAAFIRDVMQLMYEGASNQATLRARAQMDGLDPWGRPYIYSNASLYSYRVWSRGPDTNIVADDVESGTGNY